MRVFLIHQTGKGFFLFLAILSLLFHSCIGVVLEDQLQLLPIKGLASKPNRHSPKDFHPKDVDYAIANQDYALAASILSQIDTLEASIFQKYLNLIKEGFGQIFLQTLNRDGAQEALPYYYSLQSLGIAEQYLSAADFSEQLFDYYVKKQYFAAALSLAQNTLKKGVLLGEAIQKKFQGFVSGQFRRRFGNVKNVDDKPDFWEQRMGGTVTIFVKMGTERIPSTQLYLPSVGIGSGFFIDNRGSIVTNHHVISGMTQKRKNQGQIFVKLSERDELIPARLLGWDSNRDLALLQISRTSPYLLRMNDNFHLLQNDNPKPTLAIGKELYAIGAPGGLGNTLTSGRVSARGRKILPLSEALQVDVPANPGNSGGPLLNSQGLIEGIVFAKNNEGYEGIAFAIPSDTLGAVLPRLYQRGEVQNSWLGLLVDEYSKDEDYLEIRYIFPGSPADQSSLKPGMRIVSYRGNRYSKVKHLQNQISNAPAGSLITLATQNQEGNAQKKLFLELRKRPNKPMYPNLQQESTTGLFYALFGAELQPSAGKHNIYQVVLALPNSQISELGINEGDYIQIIKWFTDTDKNLIFVHIAYQYQDDLEQRAKQSVLIQQLNLPNIL